MYMEGGSRSEECGQSTEGGDGDSYTVELEHGVAVAHQPRVGSTEDRGVGRWARGWGRLRKLGVGARKTCQQKKW